MNLFTNHSHRNRYKTIDDYADTDVGSNGMVPDEFDQADETIVDLTEEIRKNGVI